MDASESARSLTICLEPELYAAAIDVARKRAISLDALVQDSLVSTVREASEQQRYDDYSLIGEDSEVCDVEYALAAQSEIVLHDKL